MTLDLGQVAVRLPLLVERARQDGATLGGRLSNAIALLHEAAADPLDYVAAIKQAQTSWPLALPYVGRLDEAVSPPEPPAAYDALAVDGSSIDIDRNLPIDCFVLNFGWMHLRYGADPSAARASAVELQPTDDEVVRRDGDDPSRESALRGDILGLLRGVRELAQLADLAEQLARAGTPLLALVDGNLALWNIDRRDLPQAIVEEMKNGPRGARQALDRLSALAAAGNVVFSGYVSRTGAANVANSLRVRACPDAPSVVCKRCPGRGTPSRPCDGAGAPNDAALMLDLLAPWQRSAVFLPYRGGRNAEEWYARAGHEIAFFYLNAGGEIARVELPVWIARDPARLALLHSLLVRQAQVGDGYPLALREAHEQAVISTGDRSGFTALLAHACEQSGIAWLLSAKAWQKHVRAI
jgi:hypothetical protein